MSELKKEELIKENVSGNIKTSNKEIEILKTYFSNCFDKDGNFNFEKFKDLMTEKEVNFSSESYVLNWLGKSYARFLINEEATTFLRENKAHNEKPENINSENILIKGDNLEVLKHLVGAYYEKIKMIYIDPPYNTGSDDFLYQDSRKYTAQELMDKIGINEEKALKIIEFTQSRSNSHSAWMTFMYPRLYIAKQLLRDDGVIFVSIDDNEVAQLRLLMDEVFGEENFVGQIVWQTATDNNPTQIATEHEYVLVFVKNKIYQDYWEIPSEKGKIIQAKYEELKSELGEDLEQIQKQLRLWIRKQNNGYDLSGIAHYSYVDEKGVYYPGNSANTKPGGYNYDIIHPVTNKICAKPAYGYRFTLDTFNDANSKGDIQWGEDETTIPKIKKRLDTVTQQLKSYYYEDNRSTSAELKELFNGKKVFDNPKSINFLKHILKFITSENDLILDFFAGSGTTGDAVMQLNAEDGGNRKYILVQLDEPIKPRKNKEAYNFVKNELKAEPTIFEITKERLTRAAKNIKEEINNKIIEKKQELEEETDEEQRKQIEEEINNLEKQDLGFQVFETFPIWNNYVIPEEYDPNFEVFDGNTLSHEDLMALLTTWKVYDGMPLTQKLTEVDLDGYTAYYSSEKKKMYLMFGNFSTKNLITLLRKVDMDKTFDLKTVVLFGYTIPANMIFELSQNFKTFKRRTKIDLKRIIRY